MKEENAGVFWVAVFLLALLVLGVVLGMGKKGEGAPVLPTASARPVASATGQEGGSAGTLEVRVDAGDPPEPREQEPTPGPSLNTLTGAGGGVLPPGLEVTGVEVVTYVYRLDEWGVRVWSEAGVIPAGRLVKVQGCIAGFRQVEYQPDMEDPGWWRVEWIRCTP